MDKNSCATEFGDTDVSLMLIPYLFDDTACFLSEELETEYVRNFMFSVTEMIQIFLFTVLAATSSLRMKETIEFVSLFGGRFHGQVTRMVTSKRAVRPTPARDAA